MSFAPVDISGQPSTSLLGITLKPELESHYELSSTIQILNLRANGFLVMKVHMFRETISNENYASETLGLVRYQAICLRAKRPEVYALRTFRDNRLASACLGVLL